MRDLINKKNYENICLLNKKIELEIEAIEKQKVKKKFIDIFLTRLQIITPLITILSLLTAFIQFSYLQYKEREEKINSIIMNSQKIIFSFPYNKSISNAEIINSYLNLDKYLKKEERKKFNETIISLIKEEIDFSDIRHTIFVKMTSKYWDDYSDYLKFDSNTTIKIVENIIDSIENYTLKKHKVFSQIYYEKDNDKWVMDYHIESYLKNHFLSLINILTIHMKYIIRKTNDFNHCKKYLYNSLKNNKIKFLNNLIKLKKIDRNVYIYYCLIEEEKCK